MVFFAMVGLCCWNYDVNITYSYLNYISVLLCNFKRVMVTYYQLSIFRHLL